MFLKNVRFTKNKINSLIEVGSVLNVDGDIYSTQINSVYKKIYQQNKNEFAAYHNELYRLMEISNE
jgi:hypothetical protein